MGCSGSKATDTKNQNGDNKENEAPNENNEQQQQQQQEGGETQNSEEEVYVTEQEAITYVCNELGISEEKGARIVAKINKNEDGKIANKELIALWEKVREKRDEIRPKFAAYDADNSGFVSCDEAYEVLKDIFKDIPESHVRAMVARFDENNSGRMNFDEFVYFYANICAKREQLLESFNALDKDGSGQLAPDEIVQVLKEECVIDELHARSICEDFDVNKDGQLSKEEFTTLFTKLFS